MDKTTRVTIAGNITLTGADQVRQQAEQVRKAQEEAEEAASKVGQTVEYSMGTSAQATTAFNDELRKLPELLRQAFQSLKSGDFAGATKLNQQASIDALRAGDNQAFQATNTIHKYLYENNNQGADLSAKQKQKRYMSMLEDSSPEYKQLN